jgi:threonine-phosphate decarboxylase
MTAEWLSEEKDWFYAELSELEGLKVYKPDANFILIRLINAGYTASSLREQLISNGLIIRDASSFKYLDESYFRVAVRDRASNQQLLNALSLLLARDDKN